MRFQAIATFLLTISLSVFAADQNVGTWKVNIEKSKFRDPALWKGRRMIIEPVSNGLKIIFEQPTTDDKARNRIEVRYYDKESPVEGRPGAATLLQHIDNFHFRTIFKTNGKQTGVLDGTISPDGKTMTNTFKGTDSKGNPVEEIRVFERQ